MGRKISSGKGDSQPTYFYSQVIFEAFVLETLQDLFVQEIFPLLPSRQGKFPEDESLDGRVKGAVAECVLPHLHKGVHIAIKSGPSHGLCIFEAIAALLCLDSNTPRYEASQGLLNKA